MNTQDAGPASTTSTSNPEVTTQPSRKDAYLAARREETAKVNELREKFLAALIEAEEIHVEEDYEDGLVVILGKHEGGLPLASIQRVFGDAAQLRIAKKSLMDAKTIEEKPDPKKRNSKVLILMKK